VITQNASVPADRRVWNELIALRDSGYEPVAICPQGDGFDSASFERREEINIYRYAQTPASGSRLSYVREYATALWRIRMLARRVAGNRGFDVVQASNPPDFLLVAVRFLRRRGTRMIFDHHDLTPELFLARFGGDRGIAYRLMLLLERLSYHLADVALATNESYRLIALERGRKRPEDVFVVRSDPELTRFQPLPGDPALKRGRRYLLSFVGQIEPQDGLDHAVRALAHLAERRDDWHAGFAGEGSALDDVRRLTAQLGLDDEVECVGWLQDAELQRLLCSSDICLVPDPKTPLSDASTLVKIAEYMAMSRPIVAYDLKESRVSAGAAALYARPNDPADFARAIGELLDDPDQRAAMGRLGRERVEQLFSWKHSKVELLAAYEAVLTRPRSSSASRWSALRKRWSPT